MFVLDGAGAYDGSAPDVFVENLRRPDLSCGTYSLATGCTDPQEAHTEDELYICTTGSATLWTRAATARMVPGSVAFVPAREVHRFIDVEEDFTVLVVFGPAEFSRVGRSVRRLPARSGR